MGRNHVHFATDVPANGAGEVVISGMRRDARVLVWVDVRRAMEVGGLGFWRSENGVVLCEGDARGVVGLEFVHRVVDRGVKGRGGERVLWEGGRVVGELEGMGMGMGKGKGQGKGRGARDDGVRGGGKGTNEKEEVKGGAAAVVDAEALAAAAEANGDGPPRASATATATAPKSIPAAAPSTAAITITGP